MMESGAGNKIKLWARDVRVLTGFIIGPKIQLGPMLRWGLDTMRLHEIAMISKLFRIDVLFSKSANPGWNTLCTRDLNMSRWLVTCGADRLVIVWEARTSRRIVCVREYISLQHEITC